MFLPFTKHLIVTTPFDPEMSRLADLHYSRQSHGNRQFCSNGKKLVIRDWQGLVLFVWMNQEFRWDNQTGYNCQIFRNDSSRKSSEIILECEQLAVTKWGSNRAFTFVDASKIRSINPGCCFKKAGWTNAGMTKSGKHIL